jgi:hypothetical protein
MGNINRFKDLITQYGFVFILLSGFRILCRKITLYFFHRQVLYTNHFKIELIPKDLDQLNLILHESPELPLQANILHLKKQQLFRDAAELIISDADRFCTNTFNILGKGWLKWELNGKIDWHTDKASGYRWESDVYYTDISKNIRQQIKNADSMRVDPKVTRELSHFHFLFGLYFAFVYSDKKYYLDKIKDTILHWIVKNPPYFGINWSNAMAAGIRISNWCLVVYALKNIIIEDDGFMKRFYQSLYLHIIFINRNLENLIVKNNHYIANLVGIYIASLLFPVFPKSRKWLKFSSKHLKKELQTQVYSDGGDCENSTAYQRFVTELFFLPMYLARQLGSEIFNTMERAKIRNMFNLLASSIKPGGKAIQFGDNDNGRLFKLSGRQSLDYAYMISLASGIFANYKGNGKEIPADILSYIFGGDSIYPDREYNTQSFPTSRLEKYDGTGLYFFKNRNFYLAVSCMPNGQNGQSVHIHNDKLSFEMSYQTYDIIVDPGTYTYMGDPVVRNRFRSTRSHNTVMENNFEQNRLGKSLFKMYNDASVIVNTIDDTILDCQHNGFVIKGGAIHRRIFNVNDRQIIIKDVLDSSHPLTAFLHFAPDIVIQSQNDHFIVSSNNRDLLKLDIENARNTLIEQYDYSPGYGESGPAYKLVIKFYKELTVIFNKIK